MSYVTWQEIKDNLRRLPGFISQIRPLNDDLTHYAASLSFYTLFAIIPMFWILFSVFSQMPVFADYYEQMKNIMMGFVVPGQSEQVIAYLDGFLENSSHMGWVGLVYILFTSALFFSNYADIVNRIFEVPNRKLSHSVAGFTAVMIIAPFVLGASLAVSSQLLVYFQVFAKLSWYNGMLSYFLLCLFFFSIYKFSPNVPVYNVPALVSAAVVAALWQLAKNGFVYYVLINRAYSTIYGSFSLLLFTMLWIYLSWILCLYGFKLCYYLQYYKSRRLTN
jgi:membrane protein